jgi:hypothetical protein
MCKDDNLSKCYAHQITNGVVYPILCVEDPTVDIPVDGMGAR